VHDVAGSYTIIDLDLARYDRLAQRFERERAEGEALLKSGIATHNPEFNRLIEHVERVALRTRDPILLTGPTGAGKSQLARRIYELKHARRLVDGVFVELNCATLRGTFAMSALFGHTKGAFTGATSDRKGLLRAADGGILFLDEIGELGLDEQAMLLRAVEEKRFLPLGADREVSSSFQLLAGTYRDLPRDVREGRFREDLLARINLWTFRLPGLADRREDIEPNFAYEVERAAERTGSRVSFNRSARERFLAFATSPEAAWRANFRDLNAAVVRMATLCRGGRVTVEEADEEIARLKEAWRQGAAEGADPTGELAALLGAEGVRALDRFDAVQLAEVVRVCRASASLADAGRRLFAASRAKRRAPNDSDRVRKYLLRFGLDWAAVRRS
jgi:transcriptional regulatory protein RtcR